MTPSSVPARLAAFGALLLAIFGAAFGLGAVVDPTEGAPRPAHGAAGGHATDGDHAAEGSADGDHATTSAPAGLAAAQDGLTLVPERTRLTAGRRSTFRFRIVDAKGAAVRGGYELESERELHLVVVRRDGAGFQHLHPRRDAAGVWSVPLALPSAGSHRVLADFVLGGVRRTLGVDVEASGTYAAAPPAVPTRTAGVDGFRVDLAAGTLRAGGSSALRLRVSRAGRPVADLQPYLGARGHLVALREGDLAYLHVHPEPGGAPGEIPFAAHFPSAGRYRLYLQFRVGGRVRTARLVVEVAR
jgi:hypothetical protein